MASPSRIQIFLIFSSLVIFFSTFSSGTETNHISAEIEAIFASTTDDTVLIERVLALARQRQLPELDYVTSRAATDGPLPAQGTRENRILQLCDAIHLVTQNATASNVARFADRLIVGSGIERLPRDENFRFKAVTGSTISYALSHANNIGNRQLSAEAVETLLSHGGIFGPEYSQGSRASHLMISIAEHLNNYLSWVLRVNRDGSIPSTLTVNTIASLLNGLTQSDTRELLSQIPRENLNNINLQRELGQYLDATDITNRRISAAFFSALLDLGIPIAPDVISMAPRTDLFPSAYSAHGDYWANIMRIHSSSRDRRNQYLDLCERELRNAWESLRRNSRWPFSRGARRAEALQRAQHAANALVEYLSHIQDSASLTPEEIARMRSLLRLDSGRGSPFGRLETNVTPDLFLRAAERIDPDSTLTNLARENAFVEGVRTQYSSYITKEDTSVLRRNLQSLRPTTQESVASLMSLLDLPDNRLSPNVVREAFYADVIRAIGRAARSGVLTTPVLDRLVAGIPNNQIAALRPLVAEVLAQAAQSGHHPSASAIQVIANHLNSTPVPPPLPSLAENYRVHSIDATERERRSRLHRERNALQAVVASARGESVSHTNYSEFELPSRTGSEEIAYPARTRSAAHPHSAQPNSARPNSAQRNSAQPSHASPGATHPEREPYELPQTPPGEQTGIRADASASPPAAPQQTAGAQPENSVACDPATLVEDVVSAARARGR